MKLSRLELAALQNLANKRAGQDVDWIGIADARALTEFGLARRVRSGWEITDAGLQFLKDGASPATPTHKAAGPGEPDPAQASSVVTGYFASGPREVSNDPDGADRPS